MLKNLKDIFSLVKIIICLAITFTTFTGYVIQQQSINFLLIPTLIGVFLLAAGASAFNHIAEANTDALMNRTKNRPIPSGRLSKPKAIFIASIFSFSGFLVLIFYTNPLCAFLGLFNLLWYNLVYTPLKKKTVWAVFLGTITGVIPFFMGIAANTENLFKPDYLFIGIYMMIWQIPHFLILISIFGHEYEQAGLASVTSEIDSQRITKISSLWIISSCLISMFLPLFGILQSSITSYIIIIFSLIIILIDFLFTFFFKNSRTRRILFAITNIMQSGFMIILTIDSLL